MRAEALVYLKDAPGTLLEALQPISIHGGNVLSVSHFREKIKGGIVPTLITFEVNDLEQLEFVKKDFLKQRIKVTDITLEGRKILKRRTLTVVLVGHVMGTDAKNTIDRLDEYGAFVSSFDLSIAKRELPSAALLNIVVEDSKYDGLLKLLDELSEEKKLIAIREVEAASW